MRSANFNQTSYIGLIIIALAGVLGFAATMQSLGFSLLAATTSTATSSSASGLEFYTGNGIQELTIVRGGTQDQVLKWQSNGQIGWGEDATTQLTGAGAVALDLTDDDVNESSGLTELATSGCSGSAFAQEFTEPASDKLLITCNQPDFTDLSGSAADSQVPDNITIDLAATASALAANGANCSASSAPLGVNAAGAVESCTDFEEELNNSAGLAGALSDENGTGDVLFDTDPILGGTVQVTGSGTTFTLNLDCTLNANGGALTTNAAGVVSCSDDDNSGGGSGNSFVTIDAELGDDPVADSSTDTLTLTSPNATVAITGSASTDALQFDVLIAPRLTANGANCVANQFNKGVDAFGAAEACAALLDADIPDDITIDLATTATALASDPADCAAGTKATAIAANGDLTCSAVDISADTNLAGGRSITISGDSVEADAELFTHSKCIWFEDPTASDDFNSIWRNSTANAITLTEIWAESDQTVNFDLQIDDGTPADVNGTDISPAAGEAEDTTLSGDTTLGVDEELDLAITSVSGTPTWVSICWTYTVDD